MSSGLFPVGPSGSQVPGWVLWCHQVSNKHLFLEFREKIKPFLGEGQPAFLLGETGGGVGETRGALKPGGIQGLQESPTLTRVCPEPNGKTLAGVCPLPLPLPLLRSREQQQQTHPNYKAGEGRSLQPRL